jgi:uncharacterized protein YkwD
MNLDELIHLHNKRRKKSRFWRLPEFKKDAKLMEYAQRWAVEMSADNKLYHSKITDIMRLGYNNVAENIAAGQKDMESVMDSWMKSMGHRSNILNRSFTNIGCGYAISKNGTPYWCVCFGTPNNKKN